MPTAAARLTEKKIGRVLSANRIRRITASEALAILKRPALTVSPGTTEAARAHMAAVAERIRLVNRRLKALTRRLDMLVDQLAAVPEAAPGQPLEQHDAAILRSLPGAGTIVLATLLAEAHQAIQARDYHAIRTLTGLAPVTKRSGKSCRVEMRQACSHRLRTAVYHSITGPGLQPSTTPAAKAGTRRPAKPGLLSWQGSFGALPIARSPTPVPC
jgi:transposase